MSRPDLTEAEKAALQLSDQMELATRGDIHANDFVAFVLRSMDPKAVKGLAADWDDAQADNPEGAEGCPLPARLKGGRK